MTDSAPAFAELPARASWRMIEFISDLHLKAEEPGIFNLWRRYLLRTHAEAVFILGDLFEFWVGDDCATPGSFEASCAELLRTAGRAIDLFFMPGNRDFLVGKDFLAHCHMQPLEDPTVLAFGPARYLLTHGDQLCTGDMVYQQFRAQVRSAAWQQNILARPLPERQQMARQMRERSEQYQANAATHGEIDADLARRWLEQANAATLIHGHTHQPGERALGENAAGQPLRQLTLSDWNGDTQRMQIVRLSAADGLRLVPFNLLV